jgi:hypothetical protein
MLYRVHLAWAGFELTTLVVVGTDSIGSCKSNYHEDKYIKQQNIFSYDQGEGYICHIDLSDYYDIGLYAYIRMRGRHGRVRMVIGFTTSYAISTYHH